MELWQQAVKKRDDLRLKAVAAWTEEAKVTSGDPNAEADFTNFDSDIVVYAKTRANKYATTTTAAADGDQTASTDGDSANGDAAGANTGAAGAN